MSYTIGCGEMGSSWDYRIDTSVIRWGYLLLYEDHAIECEKYNDSDFLLLYSKCTVDDIYSVEKFYSSGKELHKVETGSLLSINNKKRKGIIDKLHDN